MSTRDAKELFTAIYEQELDALFRFCLVRVSDRERALDITQESFTRLWHSMYSGEYKENPRAFLFVVARNLIVDWYRRKKAFSLEGFFSEETDQEFDVGDDKATVAIEHYTEIKQVLRILNTVSPLYKEVIYLRFIEGLTPKDIGEIMKISPNTVSVRITRGLSELRRFLGVREDNENKYE